MDKHLSDRGKKIIYPYFYHSGLEIWIKEKIAHLISVTPNDFGSKTKNSIVSTRPF